MSDTHSGDKSSEEQDILQVLKFHESRLGKIEKYMRRLDEKLDTYISEKKAEKKNDESMNVLKDMVSNLTEQVELSQEFVKEIKESVCSKKKKRKKNNIA